MKVLICFVQGEDDGLYIVNMTQEEWDEVKGAHDHFLGESGPLDFHGQTKPTNEEIEQFKDTMRKVSIVNLALQSKPTSYDKTWANELGVDPSWIGKWGKTVPHTSGPINVDEYLYTGYFA